MVNGRGSVELKRAGSRVLDGCPAENAGASSSNTPNSPGRASSMKTKASSLASSLIMSLGGGNGPSNCSNSMTSSAGQPHSSNSRPTSPGMPSCNPPSGSLLKSKSKDSSSVSWAGANSSVPSTPMAAASLTDPGSSSPFARTGRGNSISSHRPLLPDAVFVPENPTHGPLQHKHSGCNVTFLPDHVFLQESSTEAVCSDAEDGEAALVGLLRSNTIISLSSNGNNMRHPSSMSTNTGTPATCQGRTSATEGSSLAGGSTEGFTRQKSKVSFFLNDSTPGDSKPSTPRHNNNSNSGTGANSKIDSRPLSANGNNRVVTFQDSQKGGHRDSSDDDDGTAYKRSHTIALGELKSTESSSCPGQINRPNGGKSSLAAAFGKLTVAVDDQMAPRRDEVETPGAQALHYKQKHGYLPSRANSFAGNGLLAKGTDRTGLSQGGSNKSSAGGARSDNGEDDDTEEGSLLPALPPGVVPLFGSAAGSSNSAGSRVGGASAIAAAAAGADQQLSARAASPLPPTASTSKQQLLVPNTGRTDRVNSGFHSSSTQHQQQEAASAGCQQQQQQYHPPQVPKTLALAPANTPEPVLLAVSPRIPPNLQRRRWCLADFVLHKKLYDGYASTIYKAMDRQSGTTVALKLYHMSKLNSISNHQVAREVRLHIGLDHENIISLYAAFQESGSVVLVQEYAGGGDLWSYIDTNSGRLSERVTVSLVLQPFLKALQYLHYAGIIHRDIKPENVLFTSGMVLKIADFGLAVSVREERAVTRVGTLDYMAPEVLRCPLKRNPGDNKDRSELHYSQAVDSWAVGILAFELLTGRAPFSASGASDNAIEAAIQQVAPSFPSRMSDPAVTFITAALHKNPGQRPNILQLLQHPWIRSYQRSSSNGRAESMSDPGMSHKHGTHPPSMLQQLVSRISRKELPVNYDDSGLSGYGSGTR